ncbi:MAG: DUF6268 family outer membrane beta-barrel protein [Pirellulales bacterium]
MRYHSARVVLGACLVAATAAAQAPASSSFAATRGQGSFERAPTGGELDLRSPNPEVLQQGQDPELYTLRGMFRANHGQFMDRRERLRPDITLRASLIPNERIVGEPGTFDLFGYDFDGAVKALVSPEGYLTFGGYYLGRHYTTSSAFGTKGNVGGIGDETLVGAGVRIGFGAFLDDNWLFEAETRPGVWSDLDDTLHHQDFDFPSSAMFTYRAIDNFFFKFGARYNQVYEDAPWLPILGFSWEVVDGFRLDILAPESVEMSFWPNHQLGILFGAEVNGAEYHVHTAEALNQRANLRVQEATAYLGLMTVPNDNISFLFRAGIVIAGDYDLTTGAAGFNRAEGALDQALFLDASFGLRF